MKDVISRIAALVDKGGLITGADVAARPADWMGLSTCQAKAVVRPRNTAQLSEVMKICHAAGQSVVAAGGLTGVVRGADATGQDILISFELMTEVETLDPVGRTITVQSGAQLQKVQEAAEAEGLLFSVDLGSRGSATIGGNIATNAGGNQVLRYGMMRDHVLGLEVVLADGTILSSMNRLIKNNSGYDLKQMFIGAEGTLGFVTRAVLRLDPRPTTENTALVAIADFESLSRFFGFIGQNLGGDLTAFEVMWSEYYQTMAVDSQRHVAPLAGGHAYYVIVEANGCDTGRDTERFVEILGQAVEQELVIDAVIASSKTQRNAIWDIREDIEGLVAALFPAAVFDISLPINEMDNYIIGLRDRLEKNWGEAVRLTIFGHLGDGNLHIIVSPRPWDEAARELAEKTVYEPLATIGGSISAEHGIGLEKRRWLHLSRSPEELALMRLLKQALDPKGILNPEKIWAADNQHQPIETKA